MIKEFWNDIPLFFRIIWLIILGLGITTLGIILWAMIKLVLHFT